MYLNFFKRLIDVTIAIIGIIITLPILGCCIVLIKLETRGSGVFQQIRVGHNKKPFTCYKLRTMHIGTAQKATHEIDSEKITAIGRLLRRTKLDELPQLYNVILGDMSLVGPRPCLPIQQELIDRRQQYGIYEILPGITGLSQINNLDMSDPQRLALSDAQYKNSITFISDLKILIRTII